MSEYPILCCEHRLVDEPPSTCYRCAQLSSPSRHVFSGGQECGAIQLRALADSLDELDKKRGLDVATDEARRMQSLGIIAAEKAELLYGDAWLDDRGWVAAYADSLIQRAAQAAHEHFLDSAGGGDRDVMREHAMYAAAAALALVNAIDRSGEAPA